VEQIIIHKANEPDVIVNFFDADGLAGKDGSHSVWSTPFHVVHRTEQTR